jgi:septal ring factor EnvC (AmiA/AmiB activator)
LIAVAIGVLAPVFAATGASGDSLGQLSSQLGAQQARQQSLSSSLGRLSQLIGTLTAQISLVQTREAAVQAELDADRQRLQSTREALAREQARLARLRAVLAHAQMLLSRQLMSSYESSPPDVVSVVLEAHGFKDLLDRFQFLADAEHQQQTMISVTRRAKEQAHAAAVHLATLAATENRDTLAAAQRVAALAGMNALLHARQGALARARAAQQAALAATRARTQQLRSRIARIQAQQAAARAAAAAAAAQAASTNTPTALSPALGPSGGWAIPYAIVLCESGGQNLTPNSAGASGYYQIMPATWKLFGGTGPAAYLAGKAEQDAVATRIWNGGAGASNWVCAGIVGIH